MLRTLLTPASIALCLIGCNSVGPDVPPDAAFAVGCVTIVDSVVTFTNASTGASRYEWDFGDGRTSTESNPTIRYSAADTYAVRLVASDTSSRSHTAKPTASSRRSATSNGRRRSTA